MTCNGDDEANGGSTTVAARETAMVARAVTMDDCGGWRQQSWQGTVDDCGGGRAGGLDTCCMWQRHKLLLVVVGEDGWRNEKRFCDDR